MRAAEHALNDDGADTLRPPPPSEAATTCAERVRVLLVEPAPLIRQLVLRALLMHGYEVECVASLAEACRALGQCPDIVLVELNLADGSGDTVCARARARFGARVPVVLMSAGSEADLLRRATRCGAAGVFSKLRGLNVLLPLVNQLAIDAATPLS